MESQRGTNSPPIQKLSIKQKGEEWRKQNVDYYIAKYDTTFTYGVSKKDKMKICYDLYNSIFDETDFKYVTDPYRVQDGFPASIQNFNIIKPKIDLLIGEETKRPYSYKVIQVNEEATSKIQQKYRQLLSNAIVEIAAKGGPEDPVTDEDLQQVEDIAKYLEHDYVDIAEALAYHTLEYLSEKEDIQSKFVHGFKDGLISGMEIHYVGVLNGEPVLERVNPLFFSFDNSPDVQFIEDGDYAVRRLRMSIASVYDRLYDIMDESKLDDLLAKYGNNAHGSKANEFNKIVWKSFDTKNVNDEFDTEAIDVYHVTWKSFTKVGFLTYFDEDGEEQREVVSEEYEQSEGEDIVWDWVTEIWEGYRVGDDIYAGIAPIPNQHISIDNPNSQKLPYIGAVYNNDNTRSKSLVEIMKPLQYMYLIIWYRLEVALARDKGRVISMDITQIPKSMGVSTDKWLHYLSSMGVNFFNPYEEGWCFAPGTKVLMFDGSIKSIEDIQLGDLVMGPDGISRKVLELHSGIDHMYKIKPFVGSDEQIVNSKHRVYHKYRETWTNKIHNKVSSVKELYDEFTKSPRKKEHCYLERVSNIDNWSSILKLDPYFLGLWLGDGFSDDIAIENADPEVLEYLQNFAIANDLRFSVHPNDKSKSVTVRLANVDNPIKGGKMLPNPIKDVLVELGVYGQGNKDIPSDYIYTSKENRLQLLAGLIDTDGSFCNNGKYYEFTQCADRKHIVDKFLFIARSLGFKCKYTIKPGQTIKIHKNKSLTIAQPTYSVRIYHGDFEIPCKISRKQHAWKKRRVFDEKLTTFDIEYNGIGEYYGFSTDGDHLFLLSDYTIVHNSIPGREGGKPASYNQFSSMDLTMSNVIADHIGLMNKIEEMIGELSGVSRQRQGQVQTSELVGNVERAVIQSSHITEVHFWIHNRIKKRVLEALLEAAKQAWAESGKQKLHYITDDMTRIFMDITDDFLYSDFGIFASDSTKEARNLEAVRNLLQPAMQNGASLSDVTEIIVSNNLTEIRKKLKEIDKNRQKRENEMMQQQNEASVQTAQMQMELKAEELRIKEEDSIRKSDTEIRVAMIQAGLEEEKLLIQADKISADIDKNVADNNVKQEQLDEQVRTNKANEAIKMKQVQVQASKPKTTKN